MAKHWALRAQRAQCTQCTVIALCVVWILVAPRVSSDGKVGRHARAVSVVSCDVGCASRVESFDVDEDKGVGPIVVMEDDVGDVRDRMILHPLVNSSLASLAAALGCDT